MRSVYSLALTAVLVAAANAGQTFSFSNPFAGGGATYANAMFETIGVHFGDPSATLENKYTDPTDTVTLKVSNYTPSGLFAGTDTYNDVTFSLTDLMGNSLLQAPTTNPSGDFVLEGGILTFSTASVPTLLQVRFEPGSVGSGAGILTDGGFGSDALQGELVTITGTAVDPTYTPGLDQGLSKYSFGFPAPIFLNPNAPSDPTRYTSDFTASIGVVPVPEPSTMAALALGGLAALRRRRRV